MGMLELAESLTVLDKMENKRHRDRGVYICWDKGTSSKT